MSDSKFCERDDLAESAFYQIGRRKSNKKKPLSILPQGWKPLLEVSLRPDASAELSELTTPSGVIPEVDQTFLNLYLNLGRFCFERIQNPFRNDEIQQVFQSYFHVTAQLLEMSLMKDEVIVLHCVFNIPQVWEL
uniref:Uncharacterized protein n=1 Tax=Trichuris muris TaxID=70415 RepID=A0A5S6QDA0_TRIMR